MKFRSTFILLVLAGGLFAYLYFVEQHQQTTNETKESSRQVMKVDRDEINAISIKSPESKIELKKKEDNTWYIEDPVKDRADTVVMTKLFTTLEGLKHTAAIGAEGKAPDKEQVKEFGLANPETKIKLDSSGKTVELLIGKDAAVEGKIYAKVEGANAIYVIDNDLKTQVSVKADAFRDRQLTNLGIGDIKKAIVKTTGGEIEMEKKDSHWFLVKPLKARGDDSKIGDLVSQAITVQISSFVADSANLSAYGLETPRGSVTLQLEGSDQPVVLNIGTNPKDAKNAETVYAKLSSRNSVVLLPKSIETLLNIKPNELRDAHLARFASDIVDRVNIEPAGKEKLVLARDKENWVRKGNKDVPANPASATRVLDELNSTFVTTYVDDVATDLPKYGLDKPQMKVTVASYASENTAESKAGEKPIVSVLFGKIEGSEVYAKLDDEPFIVSVPRTVLDSIATDPLQVQELTVVKAKPEEITTFEVIKDGQPTLSLERGKDKKWKLAKGDGAVNQINAESLVNTFAGLRAVRWIGATAPADGLDTPTLVVTYKGTGSTAGKLTIGKSTTDDMWAAGCDGMAGTFLLSRPDMQAFQAPLIEKPAATSPAATPSPANPASAGASSPVDVGTEPVAAAAATPPIPAAPSEAPAQPLPPQP